MNSLTAYVSSYKINEKDTLFFVYVTLNKEKNGILKGKFIFLKSRKLKKNFEQTSQSTLAKNTDTLIPC